MHISEGIERLRGQMKTPNAELRDYRGLLAAKGGLIVQKDVQGESGACATCGGMGWVRVVIKDTTAPSFGKLVPCPDCGVVLEHRQERLDEISGLSEVERRVTLDDLALRCEDTPGMIDAVREFAANPWGFLTLHGDVGNGKTIALMALANHFRKQGKVSVYVTFVDLLDYIRAGFDDKASENARYRYEMVKGAFFLAVDEIDKANMTQFAYEFQTRLLDDRYRLGLELRAHTAFAMNEAPEWIMPVHICSRLRDGRFLVVENKDPDLRPAKGRDDQEDDMPPDWVADAYGR